MTDTQLATVAARWWAEKLEEGPTVGNSSPDIMSSFALGLGQRNRTITPRQVERFGKALYDHVLYKLGLLTHDDIHYLELQVDYEPVGTLYEVCRMVGVPTEVGSFPWHHRMQIWPGLGQIKVVCNRSLNWQLLPLE